MPGELNGPDVDDELDSLIREFGDRLEARVSVHNDQVHLLSLHARIDAPPGTGSEFVSRLTSLADKHGLTLTLNTASKGDRYSQAGKTGLKFKQTTSAARLKRFYRRFGFKSNYAARSYRSDLPGNMHRVPRRHESTDQRTASRARALITRMTEGIRYDRVQAEMDKMVANAPGADRAEKLAWVWKNKPAFSKLYNALTALSRYEQPAHKPYDKDQIRYYVRFADRPPEPGYRSFVWHGRERIGREKGISAYPAKWNVSRGLWELERLDSLAVGPEESIDGVVEGGRLKAWLLTGPELGEVGLDGEPLLDGGKVQVIKQLSPLEMLVPGYYDPDVDLDDDEIARWRRVPFAPNRVPKT